MEATVDTAPHDSRWTRGKMKNRLASALQTFRHEIGIYRSVMADPRCPRLARWLLGGAMAYALSPIDLIPDFIPVLGHLDDLLIIPLLVGLAVRVIPGEVIAEHRARRGQEAECPASEPTPSAGDAEAGIWPKLSQDCH
jgi:uncharacterized membrane protein YkvA (DUF1232 family)